VNLATVLAHQGHVQRARQAYEAALAGEPDSVLAHLGLFNLLAAAGLQEDALAAGMDCLARARRPPTGVYTRVALLWVEADQIDSGRDFLEAHPGTPGGPGPWLARAVLEEGDGQEDAALDALGKALEREPGSWDVAQAVVGFHERRGQLQAAIPALRRGLAARGGDSLPHLVALGYSALAAEELGAAGDYLGRAVEIAPQQEEALYYLGSVHFRSGRFSAAVSLWSRLVAVAPGHDDGRANLILALARTGRIARALEVFRAAGPESRESPRLLNAAASACLLNGLTEEGLLLARRSLELSPEDGAARDLVAALLSERDARGPEQP
jgi:tetratricopeptide (TPR) repeat protein